MIRSVIEFIVDINECVVTDYEGKLPVNNCMKSLECDY